MTKNAGINRPILKLQKKPIDKFFEMSALLLISFMWIYASYHYVKLPDRIPIHFDLKGNPDDWDSKNTIWIIPAIVTSMVILLRWLNRYPHKFNYLVQIDESNAEKQYVMATRLMRYIQFIISLLFTYILFVVVRSSHTAKTYNDIWFIFLVFPALFIPTVYTVYYSFRK